MKTVCRFPAPGTHGRARGIFIVGILAGFFVVAGDALAHSFYPSKCCNHTDCGVVIEADMQRIRFDGRNWIVPVGVRIAMHNSKGQPTGFKVLTHEYRINETMRFDDGSPRLFDATDGRLHLCIDGTGNGLCFGVGILI